MTEERAEPGGPEWAKLAGPHLARYLWAGELVAGRRVLDVACGSGYGAVLLRHAGARHVLGVDRDPAAIERARVRFGDAGIEFRCADALDLTGLDGPFDLVVSFETIEHLTGPDAFLDEVARVMAPGATVVLSTPHRCYSEPPRNGRPANLHHVQEWDAREFETLLRAHFADVRLRAQVRALFWRAPIPSRASSGGYAGRTRRAPRGRPSWVWRSRRPPSIRWSRPRWRRCSVIRCS
jgi:SAM-dependent methyltransferase